MASIAIASAASLAGAAYINARFGIGADIQQIRNERAWKKRLDARIAALGPKCTLFGIFETVDPVLEALWFEGRSWTYGMLREDAERLASILYHHYGVRANDNVAVFATNSPEMIIAVLAISKLGAVAALINTNLRDDTFVHCLNVARTKFIISTPDMAGHVRSDLPHITLNLCSFENSSVLESVELLSPESSIWTHTLPTVETAGRKLSDRALLIYTSGTTGKPKACAIKNMQIMITSNPLSSDLDHPTRYLPLRTYSPLPLFHGTAFFTGLCYVYGLSGTLCLRRKFSSSGFWRDVHESKATRVLYIGELCRYLLATPPSKWDRGHRCIVAHGNGLRGDVWEEYKDRFGISEIREFYRSTEGLGKFDNHGPGVWGKGCVGYAGPIGRLMEKDTFIVKCNKDTGEVLRNQKGFCIRASQGEVGEVLGRCRNRATMTDYFDNEEATESKMLKDVFEKGDLFQKMGDLLVHESDGWIRFSDRIGDTFRWKGENVSAGEVRDFICEIEDVQDATVYGVRLTKYDGQAGGAAIELKENSQQVEEKVMKGLYELLRKKGLPGYAIPRLVRITRSIGSGVTFKQAKMEVAKKLWTPEEAGGDTLYWLDGMVYRTLDGNGWRRIELGLAKL